MDLSKIQKHFYPYRVLDIGANIGQFRSKFSQVYPNSYIFSIEASEECQPFLSKITNDYYIGMLAKDNKKYDFYSRKNDLTCTGNSMYRETTPFYSDEHIKITKKDGVMLDDLFSEDSVFDLIKIDTQGSEIDIMIGGSKLCLNSLGILLEVSFNEYNKGAPLYKDVIQYMESINFKPKDILDESRNHGSHQQDILFINEN